jgi:diaminopimelate epimerase
MELKFTKMHGLGNDFVVIDAIRQDVALDPDQIRWIADRHFGVGCDQLLLVERPDQADVDFRYRIFNADGGEVEQCGNGARCFARYVLDHGLFDKPGIRVQTLGGNLFLQIESDGQVTVDMGIPKLRPEEVPFVSEGDSLPYPIDLEGDTLSVAVLSMGNPHAVMRVTDVDKAPVDRIGPLLESHRRFPKRVNVGFMQVIDRNHIRLRVYERGAGETLACGTGACAAVVAGQVQGWLDTRVKVDLPGGQLVISWDGTGQSVFMTGPAVTVFEGTLQL